MKSWRRSRPFWGGLFIVAAGLELLSIPLALDALPVTLMFGTIGAGYLIALVMIIAGVLVWLQPGQRVFLGVIAILLAMASFVYSNLGGFLVGMILGLLGGMLAVAWTSDNRPANRIDTISVVSALRAAREIASRVQVPRWATAAALGRHCRRLVPARRAWAETDTPPAQASSLAKLKEPTG
ncbi:DUF6114 domain-containing protein [Nonomuraea zeae]|uniref:Sugar ABC transporter permease n=1 Tax=Nonomuraea zeae TaxID=1642303 RepID=A0A5S4GB87_9ACTN|nr:DUF6114 domain-containing protein [Nonomuraea zeae]TMR29721.1 sugar ABC transporter permease [Nonomuraea zeae]